MKPEKSLACCAITPDIACLCKQIDQWRKTRRRGERMPEQLWDQARDLWRRKREFFHTEWLRQLHIPVLIRYPEGRRRSTSHG